MRHEPRVHSGHIDHFQRVDKGQNVFDVLPGRCAGHQRPQLVYHHSLHGWEYRNRAVFRPLPHLVVHDAYGSEANHSAVACANSPPAWRAAGGGARRRPSRPGPGCRQIAGRIPATPHDRYADNLCLPASGSCSLPAPPVPATFLPSSDISNTGPRFRYCSVRNPLIVLRNLKHMADERQDGPMPAASRRLSPVCPGAGHRLPPASGCESRL